MGYCLRLKDQANHFYITAIPSPVLLTPIKIIPPLTAHHSIIIYQLLSSSQHFSPAPIRIMIYKSLLLSSYHHSKIHNSRSTDQVPHAAMCVQCTSTLYNKPNKTFLHILEFKNYDFTTTFRMRATL